MDLNLLALEEVAYEGLEGCTISGLWMLLEKRRRPIKCAIDKWTKPYIWNQLAQSPFINFYHVDFDSPKQPDIPKNHSDRQQKLPNFWIYDHRYNVVGYCRSYFQRIDISDEVKGEGAAKLTLEQAEEKWGDFLYIVAKQEVRQRYLFGSNNPPVLPDVISIRYIMLEIIGKSRWEGFMQADFLKFYGMDSRTSFHHLKVLIRLHLLTKQSILLRGPINNESGVQPTPPKSTKMLHLSQFSNVYTNNLQKAAAKICTVLENTPDGIMERNELKQACSEITMFKKIRQWLFQTGHIQYIVNGEIWNADNTNPIQLSHFRAGRPCYVNLLKKFDVTDVEEDTDEFIDYIENCDDIEPQLVYEETLHHQAYRVIVACKEKGITMKKLAEVMCVPFTMARSFIRYFDTNKIGRIVNVDHLKLKLQKIVAIQYLHQSETIQKIQSNKLKIAQHKLQTIDCKPTVEQCTAALTTPTSLTEKNLKLADQLDLTRVSTKSKVSLRNLTRKNYVMDAMKERPVFEGTVELYKSLVLSEEDLKSTQGQCCRKTFRKILNSLIEEGQIKKIVATIDDTCIPPFTISFYCAIHIMEDSPAYLDALNVVEVRYVNQEKKKELKKAVLENDPSLRRLSKGIPKSVLRSGIEEEENPTKIVLDFQQSEEVYTDTDDENFQRSAPLSTSRDVNSKFLTYARFQKLHVLHIYLWQLVYGVEEDIEQLLMRSHSLSNDTFIDLVQSRHIWLQHVNGLPDYKEGCGWFNVGDILALMPLEVTCRVLGIKCWSETAIQFLKNPKKRLLKMCELPPRLKYKLLVSPANKLHIDNCVDLLVLLAQMGLVAVAPTYYPKVRTEIMLFLRKEAKITDTRFSEKTYCHVVLPPDVDKFPETIYNFQSLADVEKYWTDLQFVCLNTPLGLNRAQRSTKSEDATPELLTEKDIALGKQGLNQSSRVKGLGRNYRSFTILRDFTQYYQDKDFKNLQPVVFGNGLGAGGLDAVFFAHLAKNWRYGKQRVKKKAAVRVKTEDDDKDCGDKVTGDKNLSFTVVDGNSSKSSETPSKIVVTNLMVQQRRGGKGLKRKLSSTSNVLTKKMKMERKKYFDRMISKRIENVREKIRQKEQNKKKAIRKGKKLISAMNHDDVDREALRRMKGIRVSFSEREDAYILLAEIVRAMMKLYDKGQPLEKEHKKVAWQAFRDLIHKQVPESCDKTWEAIDRRARNIKKHAHFRIIYNTCMAELEQDKEFVESLKCTKENWKDTMVAAFAVTRESYSRHFNYPMHIEKFPASIDELNKHFHIEFAHKESDDTCGFREDTELTNERQVRTSVLEDLIHCSLTAQKLTSYIPAVAFKVFDAYPPDELNEAFEYYKENRLISRYRVDLPRRRSLPISTMTYNLSTTYYRMFEPVIPLRIYQMARSMFLHLREGKAHTLAWKESEIMKLPSYYEKGSCLIDFVNVQGGHAAFLLSSMVNNKCFMDFSLPDEMTISDEAHLKKLKEGRLNYQRVAFEQRIRRGETLVHTKWKTVEKRAASKDPVTPPTPKRLKSNGGKSSHKVKTISVKATLSSNEVLQYFEETSHLPGVSATTCEAGSSATCEADVSFKCMQIAKDDVVGVEILEDVDEGVPTKSKKQVTFADATHTNKGSSVARSPLKMCRTPGMRQHGVIRGYLKPSSLFSCSYNSFQTVEGSRSYTNGSPVFGQQHSCFVFTNEAPKTKRRLLAEKINMFKDTKLHASRTSLSMQRSLTSEKLVPTNAMNTHDALVTNPMEVIIHAKLTPFRSFLTKSKMTSMQKDVWKRFCESAENESEDFQELSMDEYRGVLRGDMNFAEYQIEDHVRIIDRVHLCGVVGLKVKTIREYFPLLSADVVLHLEYHVQILLNFRMVYAVGHYDDVLVTPPYLASWCFRYPQVSSKFEGEMRQGIPSEVTYNKTRTSKAASSGHETTLSRSTDQDRDVGGASNGFFTPENSGVAAGGFFQVGENSQVTTEENSRVTAMAESSEVTADENSQVLADENSEVLADKNSEIVSMEESFQSPKTTQGEVQANEITRDSISSSSRPEEVAQTNVDTGSRQATPTTSTVTYKNIKVLPWLKLNGELNNVILKRFHETILVYIIANPGVLESDVLKHFSLLLKPASARKILNFLEINGAITRHYQWKRKTTLFSSQDCQKGDVETYFQPTMQCLLNMTDTNR